MRTIKFRGKDLDTGEWIYGHFFQRLGHYPTIVEPRPRDGKVMYYEIAVEDTTVGQFTEMLDKYGNKIYEGDIIEIEEIGGYGCKRKGVVEYDVEECAFVVRLLPPSWAGTVRLSTKVQISSDMNSACEYINQYKVIGNIHDNPELLESRQR